VPFHTGWGTFPNELGRITEHGSVVPGFYCAGWIKRGPSGVIGTNKRDSVETVGCLLEDIDKLEPCPMPSTEAMLALVRARVRRVITFADWKLIDEAEQARGAAVCKPRERFVNPFEMLSLLDARESAHAENEGEETPAQGTCN
jgi:ferredoxin--NADP+ reductase